MNVKVCGSAFLWNAGKFLPGHKLKFNLFKHLLILFFIVILGLPLSHCLNPCEGGVEYLHRDPASRKRRRNEAKKGSAIA
jgi:hypothetical protein